MTVDTAAALAQRAFGNKVTGGGTGSLTLGAHLPGFASLLYLAPETPRTRRRFKVMTGAATEYFDARLNRTGPHAVLEGRRPYRQIRDGREYSDNLTPLDVPAGAAVIWHEGLRGADGPKGDKGDQGPGARNKHTQTLTIGGSEDFFYPVWWQWPAFTDGAYGLEIVSTSPHKYLHMKLSGVRHHPDAILFSMAVDMIREESAPTRKLCSHVSAGMYMKDVTSNRLSARSYHPASDRYSGLYLRGSNTYKIVKDWAGDVNSFVGGENARHTTVSSQNNAPRFYVDRIPYSARQSPRNGQV